jgi:Glu-tRNA(Gln) amidotransferase subunit E-like FAD-binding protein
MQIKSGIEIHQQLDTHKLFCNCPSVLRKDEPTFLIRRKLHAVAGEGGEVDVAVKHEAEQDREFIYEGYDSTCLIELDEEPPHLINDAALRTVLHVALLLNCEILTISQIMRKTVVDGSNTGGFQRTVLVARNGYIETESERVGIDNISLEEDSCRVIDRAGGRFRLDRLGIPLIEIGTAPDIKSPEQAKEVALYIGDVLRSCKVKRGIGTIRQDVNISIPGHPRIEIKGFQDVKMFIPTIEKEVKRQEGNLGNKKDLIGQVRNALPNGESEFMRPMPGEARMYPETDLPLLRISKQIIDEAKRTLPMLRSDLKIDLMKKGLRDDEIQILLKEDNLEEFNSLLKIINEPRFIYKVLIEMPKQIGSIDIDLIEGIVYAVYEGKLDRTDVKQVMKEIVDGKSLEEALKFEKADLGDVESEVIKMIKDKPGLSVGGYMGLIMQKFKGAVSGNEANQILNKLLK